MRSGLKTLAQWLAFIERQHPKAIALGLERVAAVWQRMGVRVGCPVITVAGTNGKGSTCAMLEAILRAGGYRTGLYTSPHLEQYNERVRVAGVEASDELLATSFDAVEAARGAAAAAHAETEDANQLRNLRRLAVLDGDHPLLAGKLLEFARLGKVAVDQLQILGLLQSVIAVRCLVAVGDNIAGKRGKHVLTGRIGGDRSHAGKRSQGPGNARCGACVGLLGTGGEVQ